jgi:hypothetical protein
MNPRGNFYGLRCNENTVKKTFSHKRLVKNGNTFSHGKKMGFAFDFLKHLIYS